MKNTPAKIFKLSEHSNVVRSWLEVWESGGITWQKCLENIHQSLVEEVVERNSSFFVVKNIEQYCQIGVVASTNKEGLKFQQAAIEAIDRSLDMLHRCRDAAIDKAKKSLPHSSTYTWHIPYDISNSQISKQTR